VVAPNIVRSSPPFSLGAFNFLLIDIFRLHLIESMFLGILVSKDSERESTIPVSKLKTAYL
jgi:hypothetical protein